VVQGSALGPTLFTVMLSDLKPASAANKFVKFADDLTLVAPENSDTDIKTEFESIQAWVLKNAMCINMAKTKELVFHRPRPNLLNLPPPIDSVERIVLSKLLGVFISADLRFSEHVSFIITQCTQRFFLLRTLKRRGLNMKLLEIVYHALIISRITYAVSVWGGHISAGNASRINSVLIKAFKFGFCTVPMRFEDLMLKADRQLLRKIQKPLHCLNSLLPVVRSSTSALRDRGHPYTLPSLNTNLAKSSFIPRALFLFV